MGSFYAHCGSIKVVSVKVGFKLITVIDLLPPYVMNLLRVR